MSEISHELLLKIHERQLVNLKRRNLLTRAYRLNDKRYILELAVNSLVGWDRQRAERRLGPEIVKLRRQIAKLHKDSKALHTTLKKQMKVIKQLSKNCDIRFVWGNSWNIEQIRSKSDNTQLMKIGGTEFDKRIRVIKADRALLGSMPAMAA